MPSMRDFRSLTHLLLPVLIAGISTACLKPSASNNTGGSANTSSGGSSSAGTNTSGGVGTPTGGSSMSMGGSATPTGGAAVIVDPGGGMAPVMKMACADSPNQKGALPFTGGYTVTDAAKSQAMTAVQSMSTAQKASQLRGPNHSGYADIFRTGDD